MGMIWLWMMATTPASTVHSFTPFDRVVGLPDFKVKLLNC